MSAAPNKSMRWESYRTIRLTVISDSDYGYWRDLLDLPTLAEEDEACLFLEAMGKRFLVDYGYENAVSIASEYPQFQQKGRA